MRIRGKQADCGAATGARVMPRGTQLWSSGRPMQTLGRNVGDDISLPREDTYQVRVSHRMVFRTRVIGR